MSLKRNEMPTQNPSERSKNFKEVALGYTEEQAIDEAKRCLNCKISRADKVARSKSISLLS